MTHPHRPIKTSTCPSLTSTSKISYKIATDASSDIHFQIIKNSNTGKFSEEWIAYNDAKAALPIGSFSSAPLRALYQNKSLNTPGFLLAALLNEGIVERELGKRLMFRFRSDEEFVAEMQKLIDAEVDLTDTPVGDKSSGRNSKSDSAVSAAVNSGKSRNSENLKSQKARRTGTAKTSNS